MTSVIEGSSERKSRMKRTESSSSASAEVLKKTQPEEFDVVILGGGTGSTIAAWTFAGEGKRVAVVERKYIGGSGANKTWLRSENIIHTGARATVLRHGKDIRGQYQSVSILQSS